MSDHVEAVERPEPERTGLGAWVRTALVCALLVGALMTLLPFMPVQDHDSQAIAAAAAGTN